MHIWRFQVQILLNNSNPSRVEFWEYGSHNVGLSAAR
jgi:hypothetical protein